MTLQLPPGLNTDSDYLYLFVQIFDESESYAVYHIESPLVVYIDPDLAINIANNILENNLIPEYASKLYNKDFQISGRFMISLSALLNGINSHESDKVFYNEDFSLKNLN